MSALTSYQFPEIERRDWMTVAQLAKAANIKPRTIQWNCKHGDLKHCHRFKSNPNGGPDILEIDLFHAPEEYRTAYARSKSSEHGSSILKLSDKQRSKAAATVTLIQAVDAYLLEHKDGQRGKQRDMIAAFLASRRASDPTVPSVGTYYRNRARWLAGGKSLVSLADQRAMPGKGVKVEFDEAAFSFFSSLYLIQGEPKAADCYRALLPKADTEGWAVTSIGTVMRTLNLRVPKAIQVELRQGKEARRNKCDAYMIRDWSKMIPNEFWVSDHVLIDVIGIDDLPGGDGKPRRMWCTTWMDERSRYVVDYRIHRGPNSREVLASFYHAVLKGGIPQNIRIDNGKEYRCKQFAGGRAWRDEIVKLEVDETSVRPVLMDLGVTPHFANPYGARSKIVEPWHGHIIKNDFARHLPGFTGGNTQEKPEELAEIVKKGGLLHWSLLLDIFKDAIHGYNLGSRDFHGGKCAAFVRQEIPFIKKVADPRALAMLFQDRRKLMIGRMGLMIDGAAYGIGNPDIIQRQGEYVHVCMDLFGQIGTVYVFEPSGRFICTAENAGRVDAAATREDLAQATRTLKRANKMIDELATNMPVLHAVDPVERIALMRRHNEMELERQGLGYLVAEPGATEPTSYKPLTFNLDPARQLPPARDHLIQGTDSPEPDVAKGMLPENILDAFTTG